MDIHVTSEAPAYERGTSNPAAVRMVPGGVGRNVAENLARLGVDVRLLGAVGDDLISDRLLADTRDAGVDISAAVRARGRSCSVYVALLDGRGELDTAAADMSVMDAVDPACVENWRSLIQQSSMVVADANVQAPTLQRIVEIANEANVPLILEPVSVAKAQRVADLKGEAFVVTPDAAEALVLDRAPALVTRNTVVTLGPDGVRWTDHQTAMSVVTPAHEVTVVDVTGAGDAFVAGLVAALHHGWEMGPALKVALDSAAVVVGTHRSTLTADGSAEIRNRLNGDTHGTELDIH